MSWFDRITGRGYRMDRVDQSASPLQLDPSFSPYRFTNPSVRIAAIGDLHGRLDLLNLLQPDLDRAATDPDRRLIEVYLGDYIDRGPSSRQVIDYMIRRKSLKDRDAVFLRGNHEQMLLVALEDDQKFRQWVRYGGDATMMSYGVSPAGIGPQCSELRKAFRAAIPPSHLEFFKNLQNIYSEGGFVFVHAGVRPGIPLDQQNEDDMLWIREPFLNSIARFGATVVHGHTPTTKLSLRPNRIGVDTGAYQTGILTCLFVTSDGVTSVDTQRHAVTGGFAAAPRI